MGKNGWVLGIEINNLALKGSKEIKNVMRNVGLLRMNGLHLGFKDNVFDCVVFSWNILGNVDGNQRKELIRESIRVLKSGGLVVGSVYSEYSVTAQMEQYMLVGSEEVYYHSKYILRPGEKFESERSSRAELRTIFEDVEGLDILEISRICQTAYGFLLEKR